jgi:hypothetical protein
MTKTICEVHNDIIKLCKTRFYRKIPENVQELQDIIVDMEDVIYDID